MKEENKKINFKELWKNPKSKALIKLGFYLVFILIIIVYEGISISLRNNNTNTINTNNVLSINKILNNNYSYNKVITITKNNIDNIYNYSGKVLNDKELIIKSFNDIETTYLKKNNEYYTNINNNYILSTKEEIYDVIDYSYINIDNIDKYLSISKKMDNKYIIYIKDIVLNNNDNNTYIEINYIDNIENKELLIDYTNLAILFDNNITKYIVKLEYNNIGKINEIEE